MVFKLGYFSLPVSSEIPRTGTVNVSFDMGSIDMSMGKGAFQLYQAVFSTSESTPPDFADIQPGTVIPLHTVEHPIKPPTITLYHGSPAKSFTPVFGNGADKHDYGRGFYLTPSIMLAREWAVCGSQDVDGWVHQYTLHLDGLEVLDFQALGVLPWLAELMKHRAADRSRRYRVLSAKFIDLYGVDTAGYDVIKGWRADASYFFIAKSFVRDEIDVDILGELLALGDLGIQYCCKTQKAFRQLEELEKAIEPVPYADFNPLYVKRDSAARTAMNQLVESERNTLSKVFSDTIKG